MTAKFDALVARFRAEAEADGCPVDADLDEAIGLMRADILAGTTTDEQAVEAFELSAFAADQELPEDVAAAAIIGLAERHLGNEKAS